MPTIIVVEDDVETCEMIALIFAKDGHEVIIAHNGNWALDLLDSVIPDLIIMDLLLPPPGQKGWEIATAIRKECSSKHIPIIALTASQSTIDDFPQSSFDEFLKKPFSSKRLRELAAKYLDQIQPTADCAENVAATQ